MMANKNHVLCVERLRRVPKQFSWIDHRLIKDGYVKRCGLGELALYLILVTVGDRNGVSFYSDRSLCTLLATSASTLSDSRNRLKRIGLIAWESPFYQVLSLDNNSTDKPKTTPQPSSSKTPATSEQVSAIIQKFLTQGNQK